jgi:hypothetical protein
MAADNIGVLTGRFSISRSLAPNNFASRAAAGLASPNCRQPRDAPGPDSSDFKST